MAVRKICKQKGCRASPRCDQLMLGHADIKQTQRYLNITDEELRKAMTDVWERRRQLRAVSQ
jgi:site-specific recombinase XerD